MTVFHPRRTRAAGATPYVSKPVNLDGLQAIVSAIDGFWFTVVRYPEE